MNDNATFAGFIILALLLALAGYGCNRWQMDNCRESGGEPVTRTLGTEYTGCVGGDQ